MKTVDEGSEERKIIGLRTPQDYGVLLTKPKDLLDAVLESFERGISLGFVTNDAPDKITIATVEDIRVLQNQTILIVNEEHSTRYLHSFGKINLLDVKAIYRPDQRGNGNFYKNAV
jgi:hypothetical protein